MRYGPLVFLSVVACSPAAPLDPARGPREPPAPRTTVRDEPYWQELDHPLLDGDPNRIPLIAVVLDVPGMPSPLGVSADGFVDPGRAGRMAMPAEPYLAAIKEGGGLVLATESSLSFLENGTSKTATAPAAIRALLPGKDRSFVRTDAGLYTASAGRFTGGPFAAAAAIDLDGDTIFASETELWSSTWRLEIPAWRGVGAPIAIVPDVQLAGEPLDLVLAGSDGLTAVVLEAAGPRFVDVPIFVKGRVPYDGLRAAIRTPDGGLLIGGAHGAARLVERGYGPEWRAYPSERWIPSPDVYGLAVDETWPEEGAIWIATALGLAEITAEHMTLEQKLAPFVDRIVARHDRDGAVADSHLIVRGDVESSIPWDSDNDGSWTSYWLRAECYRWKVTADPTAKAHFDSALDAVLALHDRTGTDWFLARALIRKAGCKLDDCDAPDDGQWYTSPDGEWWVKADTSNDEVIGHIGMMGVAYDLCADEAQKARIAHHMSAIIGGIMDHGWQLVDLDGAVTTYGQFDPGYTIESIPGAVGDGGMRAAEILAGLTLAHYLTGEERFLEGKRELIETYNYDEMAEGELEYPARRASMDNDEMDVWSWMTLLRYETDPVLYERWQRGWLALYQKLSVQQGAQWELVHLYNGGEIEDLGLATRWLRLAPVSMVRWSINNEARRDLLPVDSIYYRRAAMKRSDGRPMPYDERPNDRWNTDQFMQNGGMNGYLEMDGADVLEPYWLARYYGFIVP